MLTKELGDSFHRTHAAYSPCVENETDLPNDTISVQ